MERVREPGLAVFAAADSLNARELLRFLRLRFRFIFGVSAGAALLALIGSLLLPKEYTAVASVFIDTPAGADPRMAVAVNPAYIESLRAYELLASSDPLFLRAVEQFHLRESGSESLERMKRRILRVAQIRDTRVLNIAVTLPDAKLAQAFAQFVAEQTVIASRAGIENADQDLLEAAQKDFGDAQARLQREQMVWGEFNARQPEQPLSAAIETSIEARTLLQSDLITARADAAESGDAKSAARVRSLETDDARLERRIREESQKLAGRNAAAEQIQQRRDVAQASFNAAAQRVRELRAQSGARSERLRLFDSGVAPDRPSWPDVPLNVAIAFAAGLLCSIVYLGVRFDLRPSDR
ncbi:MAG TPA: hypothetical protein VMB85_07985 [Bryobacteraceae bacterium]|nr:hypothetical protein [Bryobacteraceae bacterium]